MQKKYGNKIAEQETEPSDISGISGFWPGQNPRHSQFVAKDKNGGSCPYSTWLTSILVLYSAVLNLDQWSFSLKQIAADVEIYGWSWCG